MMNKSKIIFLIQKEHGTTYHRMMMPSATLAMVGVDVVICETIDEFKKIPLYDVAAVVVSRFVALTNYNKFKALLSKYDVKLIADIDDRWYMDASVAGDYALGFNKEIPYYIKDTLKIADIVWAASPYLANKIRKAFNISKDKIFVIPNGIEPTINNWEATPQPQLEAPIFGYIAAIGHHKDIVPLNGLFEGKKLVTIQYDHEDYSYGKTFGSEWKVIQSKPIEVFATLYDEINVSIAPLAVTDFNNCKSSLKVQEAGFKKRALMCSDIRLYTDVIKHNETAVVCKDRAAWEREIKDMTVSRAIELGEALYDRVKDEFNIFNINRLRLHSILN